MNMVSVTYPTGNLKLNSKKGDVNNSRKKSRMKNTELYFVYPKNEDFSLKQKQRPQQNEIFVCFRELFYIPFFVIIIFVIPIFFSFQHF